MNEILLDILSVLVTAVVVPLISLLGTKLIQWVGAKTKNEKAAKLLSQATGIVMNAVRSVFQTYVETLKKQGSFDAKAQSAAFNQAKADSLRQFTPEITEFIKANYGDLSEWLRVQIESSINALKN